MCKNLTLDKRLNKRLFLIALATGDRVSKLAAMSRAPSCLQVAFKLASVTLTPTPTFIAKNERDSHVFTPITIPALTKSKSHHPICPVKALKEYGVYTKGEDHQALWVHPVMGKKLSKANIVTRLVKLIQEANPGTIAKAHDIRKWAATVRFLRNVL